MQDITTIIQAEHEINNNPNGAAGVLPGADDKSKDLSGIVERLLWKQHQSRTSNLNDFYEQIQKPSRDESAPHTLKLNLNRVNDSDVAVYQSLQTENENSNMKDEVRLQTISILRNVNFPISFRFTKSTKCFKSQTQFWDLMERF